MWNKQAEARWRQLSEEATAEIKKWREEHPRATFQEIEDAVDEHLARIRAQMVEDVALASAATDISKVEGDSRTVCPKCGYKLEARGQGTRHLTTKQNQSVSLRRTYAKCPAYGAGLFPPG